MTWKERRKGRGDGSQDAPRPVWWWFAMVQRLVDALVSIVHLVELENLTAFGAHVWFALMDVHPCQGVAAA